jgi:hypothetical protein
VGEVEEAEGMKEGAGVTFRPDEEYGQDYRFREFPGIGIDEHFPRWVKVARAETEFIPEALKDRIRWCVASPHGDQYGWFCWHYRGEWGSQERSLFPVEWNRWPPTKAQMVTSLENQALRMAGGLGAEGVKGEGGRAMGETEADVLDMMADEFCRIKALTADPEITQLCERAVCTIEQKLPVIVQRDRALRALAAALTRGDQAERELAAYKAWAAKVDEWHTEFCRLVGMAPVHPGKAAGMEG